MIRSRRKPFLAALAGLAFVLAACGGGGSTSSGSSGTTGGKLTLAFKNFSENSIMAQMTKILLEKQGRLSADELDEITAALAIVVEYE